MEFEPVIGLEVHVQLQTASKIFSGASTAYGAAPNTQACAIDLGMPGVLPVLNKAAVDMAIKFGLATNCEINKRSVFARKNYFYPDLPKGYQISQFEIPVVGKGYLDITLDSGEIKRIGLTRAHLEEDAGKSLHEDFDGCSGIDLNRAGTPLLEIVSEPDMRTSAEAVAYLKTLHSLVRYLDICDGNMQEGSFRCDANISVRPKGQEKLGTRCEIKNVNSFRFVEKAIEFEIERQIDLIESGGTVVQQTRLYDSAANVTRAMRSKEEANDYRYFPDPDLLPLVVTDGDLDRIKNDLPELPHQKKTRFTEQYGLKPEDAQTLTQSKELGNFFEAVLQSVGDKHTKLVANFILGDFLGALNKENLGINQSPINADGLAGLLKRVADNTISGKIAKTVFEKMFSSQQSADEIIEKEGLKQVTDSGAIESIVDEVLKAFPDQQQQYKDGKDKMFGFFVGQVMKKSQGKANPQQVNDILKKKLAK
jgi:aspartyl-tRNA(Asn)/glutamyl-tRNA(Gln) amidotransferase subunit B